MLTGRTAWKVTPRLHYRSPELYSPSSQVPPRNYPTLPSKLNRPVIPSKRAAQNRAAQKAFRQRREQYVKDLEKRSTEMDNWKEELEELRNENMQLRETISMLEQRLAEVSMGCSINSSQPSSTDATTLAIGGGDGSNNHSNSNNHNNIRMHSRNNTHNNSNNNTSTDNNMNMHVDNSAATTNTNTTTTKSTTSTPDMSTSPFVSTESAKRDCSLSSGEIPDTALDTQEKKSPFLSIPSHASHSNVFLSPKDSHVLKPSLHGHPQPSSQPKSTRHIEPTHPSSVQPTHEFWSFDPSQELAIQFNFDPFFEDDFDPLIGTHEAPDPVTHASSGRVLDDLFAVLQTRQRPQIPLQPEKVAIPVENVFSKTLASTVDYTQGTEEK
ncbi:hypothetical protein BDF14DRAFT_1842503 [Spinellus fusiger]|nr:hypothetical protein BDF14DRAFT_1842503 [Spinellus fusiger]